MKKLLILLTLTTTLTFGQNSPNIHYRQMVSDVWRLDTTGEVAMLLPKWDITFRGTTKYAKKHINITEVRKHLISSLKQFKKDYGRSIDVEEDVELTKQSNEYAVSVSKKVSSGQNYTHDKKRGNCSEVISGINLMTLTMIDECDGDFNKIIADCVFDAFSASKGHTSILVNDYTPIYGFGLYYKDGGEKIWIVIRQKK